MIICFFFKKNITVVPQFNEVPRDWGNLLVIIIDSSLFRDSVPYILLLISNFGRAGDYLSFVVVRGLRYIEVC